MLLGLRKYRKAATFLESVVQYLRYSSILFLPPPVSFFVLFLASFSLAPIERLSSTLVVKIKHKLNKNALKSVQLSCDRSRFLSPVSAVDVWDPMIPFRRARTKKKRKKKRLHF